MTKIGNLTMLANFFEKTKPLNSLLVGLLFCVVFFYDFFRVEVPELSLKNIFIWGGYFLSSLFFLLLSGYVFSRNKSVEKNLFTPLILVLLYGIFPQMLRPNVILFMVFMTLLSYWKTTTLDQKEGALHKLFDSGFFLGIVFVFYNWTFLYLIVLIGATFFYGKASFRNLVSIGLGFLLPSFFLFSYCFFFDQMEFFFEQFLFEVSSDDAFYSSEYLLNPMMVCAFLVLVSLVLNFPKIIGISDRFRLKYVLVLLSYLTGLGIIAITPDKNGTEVLFVLLPMSILIAQLVESITKAWLKDLFVLGLAVYSLVLFLK